MSADIVQYDFRNWVINGKAAMWAHGQLPLFTRLRYAGYTLVTVTDSRGRERRFTL